MSKKYEPYEPTKWESRMDKALGIVSPKTSLNRMVARERMHYFRYLAAQPTSARPNSSSTTAGEWQRIQREKLQVMWNAIDMVDNSGLCSGMLIKFPTYVCGTLAWQARTGDKNVNTQYQQYIKEKTTKPGNIDVTRRFTLRQMCMLDIKCIALKGDVGTNIVRDGDEIYLQGIEANRIGDPYKVQTSQTYVRGLVLSPDTGAIVSAQVFYQDKRSGMYKFEGTYDTRDDRGLPKFLFFTNPIPISFDDYRGVSLFKHAIDNDTYINNMRRYELQALMWASAQSGVFHTKSGLLPESLPFDRNRLQDKDGNFVDTYEVRPNTVTALAEGEDVTMFQHDRPSPNVIGMYENTVRDIAIGAGLTYGFVYDMTGLTGPAVRQCSAQDARSIQTWQEMLREQKLDQIIMLLLGEAIARGELPYHPNWLNWNWFFPAKPTIDVGRESDADINEVDAVLNTGAMVVADGGRGDIQDIITQRGHEVEMMIEAAQDVAKKKGLDWKEVYALMVINKGGGAAQSAQVAAAKVDNGKNGDKPGATDNPVDLADEKKEMSRDNGHVVIQQFFRDKETQELFNPSQTRDKDGKWTNEGKGGGNGTATATREKVETKVSPVTTDELSELDKKITDYKEHRPLGNASETARFTEVVPGASFTPYTKTPFFGRVNALQGTVNIHKVDIADFVKARDEVFQTIPATNLKLENVVVTQPVVNKKRVQEIIDKPETGGTKAIQAVKYDGKVYILNGHHRVAALMEGGKGEINAHVLDLDHPEPKPPKDDSDVDRYTKELAALPEYQTVENRLKAYGKTPSDRETWTIDQHTVDGKLTPEREALHSQIQDEFLNPKAVAAKGARPQAVFLMGRPAAGKTLGAGKFLKNFGELTTLSADDLSARLPESKGWNRPISQAETKIMLAGLTEKALRERHNVVYDEVGGNFTKLSARADMLSKNGYDVHIVHVNAPISQTTPLTWKRFLESGRFTDPDYVTKDVNGKPDRTYQALKKEPSIKSWTEIDNRDFAGKVIEEGSR